ncbi:unnamed protein product [Caenorhabditis angaria]|uniref:Uncharacterized protein n=1 Tax=Caenorhabditis angaria TaxID=860376 RepID=A0A9P1J530_9PELO|nr:unnamed protein product [Caenorhabditis angaria]
MIILLFLFNLITSILSQNLYGPSQLDLYWRLLRSQNLGGVGLLPNIDNQIKVIEKQQFLSGLPPLPMTHEEMIHVLTTEAPTTTPRPTARPTSPPPAHDPFVLNNEPENPPIPEERIGGTFDVDGNFVSNVPVVKKSLARGARNYRLSDTANEQKYGYQAQFHNPIHKTAQNRFIPTATRSPLPQRSTYPPMIFRAKPQPTNRDAYLNNLLLEIEEYDDFLDQVNQFKGRYPGANVPNPYRNLPDGKLPALSQQYKK